MIIVDGGGGGFNMYNGQFPKKKKIQALKDIIVFQKPLSTQ